MTVTPKLQKGLKRLFSASVLRIIAAVLVVASVIAMLIGLFVFTGAVGGDELTDELADVFTAAASGNYDALNRQIEIIGNVSDLDDAAAAAVTGGAVTLVAGLFMLLASGVLIIIAWIMSLVGVINVSKENSRFKIALYALLGSIACGIIGGIVANGNATITDIFTLVSRVADIVMFLFICDGIRMLGEKLGRSDFLGKYNAILFLYAFASILDFVGRRFGASTLGYVIQIVGNFCFIVAFILYMTYLRKAIKAVEGVPVAEPQY